MVVYWPKKVTSPTTWKFSHHDPQVLYFQETATKIIQNQPGWCNGSTWACGILLYKRKCIQKNRLQSRFDSASRQQNSEKLGLMVKFHCETWFILFLFFSNILRSEIYNMWSFFFPKCSELNRELFCRTECRKIGSGAVDTSKLNITQDKVFSWYYFHINDSRIH